MAANNRIYIGITLVMFIVYLFMLRKHHDLFDVLMGVFIILVLMSYFKRK